MSADPIAECRAIYLVGFMGSGKSETGRALAAQLGWEFEDTDALVEHAAGCTIEEIFRAAGEGRFRELEWQALNRLDGRRASVVATGGGLFLGTAQRALVRKNGVSVWLDVPLARIRDRLAGAGGRPLWSHTDPIAQRAFFEKRRAAYALADVRVDPKGSEPAATAARIRACFSPFHR